MGDRPSGFQQRKQTKAREAAERVEEIERRKARGETVSRYEEIGAPNLDDPTLGLIFAQKYLLIALQEVGADSALTAKDRWRLISQIAGQIGMTHAKALMEHKLDRVTRKLEAKKDVSGGPKSLAGVARPATARSRAGGGRVEPASRPLPDPSKGEDQGDPAMGGGPLGSPGEKVH